MNFSKANLTFSLTLLLALLLSACVAVEPTADAADDGTLPPANQTVPAAEEITLFVGPERVDCEGVAPQECLLVKRSADADYEFFYDSIDGFTFVPGYEYELLVQQTPVENPPADASSLAYTLLEIVSQEPIYDGEAVSLENTPWTLVAFGAEEIVDYNRDETPVTARFMDGTLGGSSGCNTYSTSYALDGDTLSLGNVISTLMACPEPAMQVEQAYFDALASAGDYEIEGNLLTITYAAGQLTFMADSAQATVEVPVSSAAQTATLVLADGTACDFAGVGATLAFDGERLNYTCTDEGVEPMIGLIGEIAQDEAGMLTVTRATIERGANGFELADSEELTFLGAEITLANGTTCAFAGTGATLAFDGERLTYTCGDPSIGLLGELMQGETGQWSATKATLSRGGDGFALEETEEVAVARIEGAKME